MLSSRCGAGNCRRHPNRMRSTSISPPVRRRCFASSNRCFAAKGAHLLDAPVASGQPGAARGIHEVMVGGETAIFRARRVGASRLRRSSASRGSARLREHLQARPSNDQQHDLPSDCRGAHLGRQGRASTPKRSGNACAAAWWAVCTSSTCKCRKLFFRRFRDGNFPAQIACAKMSAWRPASAGSLTCRCRWPIIAEQNLIDAINRGWADQSAYTVTFKLQEDAARFNCAATASTRQQAAKVYFNESGLE